MDADKRELKFVAEKPYRMNVMENDDKSSLSSRSINPLHNTLKQKSSETRFIKGYKNIN